MNSNFSRRFNFVRPDIKQAPSLYLALNIVLFLIVALIDMATFFAGQAGLGTALVSQFFALPSPLGLIASRFYTILTYQFFHFGFFHLAFNMLSLYWIGQLFSAFLKPRQFHILYLGGGFFGAILFLVLFNFIPVFSDRQALLLGSSASIMAIFTALATLVPNYSLFLLFFGQVKLKYLCAFYIIIDVLGVTGTNAGGNISHLGGALFGFIFVKLLQQGTDLSAIFERKPKLKVVYSQQAATKPKADKGPKQEDIDAILDKISKSGYDKLTKEEKDTLFRASKN